MAHFDNKIRALLRTFVSDDAGAITVDWVVLTAAVIALAVSAPLAITNEVPEVANSISAYVGSVTIGTY